ncbi:hypothetical protein ACL6C3_26450 [Capilliphycus salinus ALCB114379]
MAISLLRSMPLGVMITFLLILVTIALLTLVLVRLLAILPSVRL